MSGRIVSGPVSGFAMAPAGTPIEDLGDWYACAQPERPPDTGTIWHVGTCAACSLKAEAWLLQDPDDAKRTVTRAIIERAGRIELS